MKNKWVLARHRIIAGLARPFFYLTIRSHMKMDVEKMRFNKKSPHIIIYNHQTGMDQFFLGFSFRGPIYYVATEDITSNGFISKLLKFSMNPIPFKKSTNDINAVRSCLRVIKEGGTIAIAPEGNRTYSGETGNIKPSIVKLIKKMKVPVVIYRISGGYGVMPRWTDKTRHGLVHAKISKIIQPEEYNNLTNEEFYDVIKEVLYVNEQDNTDTYKSKRQAEYLERAIYVCPKCGISEFESKGNTFRCKHCGLTTEYLNNKQFKDNRPFKNATEWYRYQENFINSLDLGKYDGKVMFESSVKLMEVIPYKRKRIINKVCLFKAYNDHIEIDDCGVVTKALYTEITAMSCLGKNKCNYYLNDKIYQIKGDKHFNALKYVNIFYHYRNVNNLSQEEDADGTRKFLGL